MEKPTKVSLTIFGVEHVAALQNPYSSSIVIEEICSHEKEEQSPPSSFLHPDDEDDDQDSDYDGDDGDNRSYLSAQIGSTPASSHVAMMMMMILMKRMNGRLRILSSILSPSSNQDPASLLLQSPGQSCKKEKEK